MSSYKELIARREALEKEIQEARNNEIASAVTRIQELVAEYDLTPEDIFSARRKTSIAKQEKVAPKYRDPVSGATWTGRGKPPVWIRDQDRAKFAI